MNQSDLNRAVAQATGESVATVKQLGFLLADPFDFDLVEREGQGPAVIDWDELDGQRHQRNAFMPSPHPINV
jgi:hypothetical protein